MTVDSDNLKIDELHKKITVLLQVSGIDVSLTLTAILIETLIDLGNRLLGKNQLFGEYDNKSTRIHELSDDKTKYIVGMQAYRTVEYDQVNNRKSRP